MTQNKSEVGIIADGVLESTAQGKLVGAISDPTMMTIGENVADEMIGAVIYYIGETTTEEPIYVKNTYYTYTSADVGWEKIEVSDVEAHIANKSNPHEVTKAQVGLSEVDNTSDANKPVSNAVSDALDLKADASALSAHTSNKNNPHEVTKAQVGLEFADNTSDLNKPISTKTQQALDKKATIEALSTHTSNESNPHKVTATQIGVEEGAEVNIIETIAVNNTNLTPTDKRVNITTLTEDDVKGIKVNSAAKADSATSATTATSATSATSATKATQDANGNVIATTYQKANLGTTNASKVLVTDASGKIGAGTITTTKLGYLANVTSDVQGQLDAISTEIPDVPTKVSELENDSGYQTKAEVDSNITGRNYITDSAIPIKSIKVNGATQSIATDKSVNITTLTETDVKAIKVNEATKADSATTATNYKNASSEVKTIASLDTRVGTNETNIASASSTASTANTKIDTHIADKKNPHGVTKAQVGLGNTVDGAQINVLEGVQIDGSDMSISNKKVNILTTGTAYPAGTASDSAFALKGFVNSSINALAAFYITKDADGNPFSTNAELVNATTYYSGGEVRTPTRNDYAIVLSDEVNGGDAHNSTRYAYDNGWEFQYIFNYQFTQAQIDALDSGATATNIQAIGTNTQAISAINSGTVMTSGITKAKVDLYDGYDSRITANANASSTNATAISTINASAPMKSGITQNKVTKYDGYESLISGNTTNITKNTQSIASINSSAVMTSGITKDLVGKITSNETAINTINNGTVMNSGITSALVSQITTNKNNIKTINDGAVMNSGITKAKVTTYDGYADTISGINTTVGEHTENIAGINTSITSINDSINDIETSDAYTSGITSALVGQITTNKNNITTINASDPMTSGITSVKVEKYDGYDSRITEVETKASNNATAINECASTISSLSVRVSALENLMDGDY